MKSAKLSKKPIVINPEGMRQYGIAAGGGLTLMTQDELDIYFSSLKNIGVQWVRWDLDWSLIQPNDSLHYQWQASDRVIETAQRFDINTLGVITYTPKWARERACITDWRCAPADTKAFGHFAGQVALRYIDSVSYWEIWNEPNVYSFWRPRPNASKYGLLLRESYIEIKKANQQAVVLSGGLAPSETRPDGSLPPLSFLKDLYFSNSNVYFDAVSFHPYSYPVSPTSVSKGNSWQQNLQIRQLMIDKKEGGKRIWITEYGAPTGGPGKIFTADRLNNYIYGSDFVSEVAQATMMKEAIDYYRQNSDWLGPLFWYTLKDDSLNPETSENFFGLIKLDGNKKPAYDLLKKAVEFDK
jgi:hypothetical protein